MKREQGSSLNLIKGQTAKVRSYKSQYLILTVINKEKT